MADKHTKKDLFLTLRVLAGATESEDWVIEGIDHEIALLDKRAAAPAVNAKKAAEQKVEMDNIVATLGMSDEPMRAGEIAGVTGDAVQKVSALLRKLVADGTVERFEAKGVATFSLK